ncbi:MAG: hypothetical protein HZB56_05740 [Deltaproteobacteria bacterium]|nr:hypothetical protein [Deltaproteobacteria bacterium]
MRRFSLAVSLAAVLAACGSSSKTTTPSNGFPQPAGTVAVNFSVNDTANGLWKNQEMEWKGNVKFDATTRIGTYDATWGGPWAKLYDDGPWDQGGHEPLGSTAGDHILGVTVFIAPPATGSQVYEYGLRDATNPDPVNGGWLWVGGNGQFTLAAGGTAAVNATGLTIPAHGTIDMKLTLDTRRITATNPPFDTTTLAVKGSAWGWSDKTCYDDGTHGDATSGDGLCTFVLSQAINQAVPPYPGLLKSTDVPEFVFVLGGVEYKVAGDAQTNGVSAYTKAGSAAWIGATVGLVAGGLGGHNTAVTAIGAPFTQPAGTVAVNFSVTDTANRLWRSGELEWKGNVLYATATRIGTYDATWGGPWAKLYDDGPWDAGGHEPAGATAGDHILGVTVFIAPPATGSQVYEYGLRDATNPDPVNGGWMWVGGNGQFSLAAGATAAVNATGLTFPAHGAIDMRLVINTAAITVTNPPFDVSTVTVKGSGWGWSDKPCYDDGTHGDATSGDGIYTFTLSGGIDQLSPPYPGLLATGQVAEFVFTLGGVEYKVGGDAQSSGVTAFTQSGAGAWTAATITSVAGGLGGTNTAITAP